MENQGSEDLTPSAPDSVSVEAAAAFPAAFSSRLWNFAPAGPCPGRPALHFCLSPSLSLALPRGFRNLPHLHGTFSDLSELLPSLVLY